METVTEPQTAAEIVQSFDPPALSPGGGQQIATREATPAGGLLSLDFAALARDPAVDADKLDKLLRMAERIQDRDAEREFTRDFIAMKPELPVIDRDSQITYEAKAGKAGAAIAYATIENIDEQITPVLQRFGFAPSYRTKMEGERLVTTCILRHRGGHKTETDGPPLPCDSSGGKNSIQGWGSAMTYGRRYSLIDALNIRIKGKDDDGKRGGARYINEAQAEELRKYLKATGTDEEPFLRNYFEVASVESLEIAAGVAARNMLLAKLDQQARKRGEQ